MISNLIAVRGALFAVENKQLSEPRAAKRELRQSFTVKIAPPPG
jgi:hypothetical protein